MEVLLSPADGGLSPISAAERISFSNVQSFRPTKAKQDQAASRLAELGFKIVQASPYSVSVEGPPSLFTKTFGTELEVRSICRVQNARPMREKAYYAPAAEASWEPPSELRDLVERAYIQPPAIYFESAGGQN